MKLTMICLAILHGTILLAPWLAPYPYAEQHREYPHAPPVRLHLFDHNGRLHARPFVYAMAPGSYQEDTSRPVSVELFPAGRLLGVPPPGVLFLLGTDAYGRDVLSRVLYGGGISLFTGLLATLVALTLGAMCGVVSGFYGGWVDRLLMRFSELFLALPWLYLLLGVRAALPLHITPVQAFLLLVTIIGTVGWVRPARLVRGVVLSAREQPYVHAARGFGASNLYLMRRHILPETLGVLLTQASVLIPRYIVAEVTLSFLGLGVGEPVPSWGNMLGEARQYHTLVAHPWMLAPGLLLVPVLLSYLILSDALLARGRYAGSH